MIRVTILAAMHGNETYGIDLHAAFVSRYPTLKNRVQLIIGNQRAYQEKVRFVDSDLNRHYNINVDDHESAEVARIERELMQFDPDYIIDVHTTRRSSGVFFISDKLNEKRRKLCAMLPIDTCIMADSIIHKSFIGNHDNAVSLEYSLSSISDRTTEGFIKALNEFITIKPATIDISRIFEAKRLITQEEWQHYPGLRNHDSKEEGIALMVPADQTEMDAEYHGFWCTYAR